MECSICYQRFTTRRKKIECHSCSTRFCLSCFSQYCTVQNRVNCPSCRTVYSREFITENTNVRFVVNVFEKYRKEVLLRKQSDMLQYSLPFINSFKRKRTLEHDVLSLQREIGQIQQKITRLHLMILQENDFLTSTTPLQNTPVTDDGKIPRKCVDENCKGLLNHSMACCLCSKAICTICEDRKESDSHTCNPDTLASISFIKENCKSCPKCNAQISYIAGCKQMFCTSCKCAFHWDSLSLIPSGAYFHNPHFTEFLVENGGHDTQTFRQLESVRDNVTFRDVESRFREERLDADPRELKFAKGFLFVANELRDTWTHRIEETEHDFRHLRIPFFLNEITQEDFKKALLKADKQREQRIALQKTFLSYANCTKDLFSSWVKGDISFEQLVDGINDAYKESNTKLARIRKIFGGSLKKFTNNHFNIENRAI